MLIYRTEAFFIGGNMEVSYRPLELTSSWGYENCSICNGCGALVYSEIIHTEWHLLLIKMFKSKQPWDSK